MTYRVGYFVGSLSSQSINRTLSKALLRLVPQDLEFHEIPIGDLPLYSPDFDADYPAAARALKDAIDWASRPWGQNSFHHMPAAVIGASIGQIGTAVGQQSLRAVLSFCNARQMTAPEAYVHFKPGLFTDAGEVTEESTAAFLGDFMQEFRTHVERVLTVIPRP